MKMSKSSVRALLPRFLLFAGLIAVAFALTGAPATSASPDFSMSISPLGEIVTKGTVATYTVTVTALDGFTGTVTLSGGAFAACGIPASFSPATITDSGTSTMSIPTAKAPCVGNFNVIAIGQSGSLQHQALSHLTVKSE